MTLKHLWIRLFLVIGLTLPFAGCGDGDSSDDDKTKDSEIDSDTDTDTDTDSDSDSDTNSDENPELEDGVPTMEDLEGTWSLASGTLIYEEFDTNGDVVSSEQDNATAGAMILSVSGSDLTLYEIVDVEGCYYATVGDITDIDDEGNLTDANEEFAGSETDDYGTDEWGSSFEVVDGQLFMEYWEAFEANDGSGEEEEIELLFDREDVEVPPAGLSECP